MTTHVLCVGGRRDIHERMRSRGPCRTTLLVRTGKVQPTDGLAYDDVRALSPLEDAWVAAALDVDRRHPVSHVVAFHEYNVEFAAAIAARLGLSFHSPRVVRAVRDKAVMRSLLPPDLSPAWWSCANEQDVRHALRQVDGPAVVKPTTGSGSEGVAVVHVHGRSVPATVGPVIVEERVVGREISVETVSEDGAHVVVGITAKFHFDGSVVERGHVFPLLLTGPERTCVERTVHRMLDALGVRSGPTHTEVILGAQGPVVVETHLRPGGDHIPSMVEDVTGTSILDLWIDQCLGERVIDRVPVVSGTPEQFSASWYRGAHRHGRWVGHDDLDGVRAELRALGHDVRALEARLPVGSMVAPPVRSADRLLVARACAGSAEGARQAARAAVERPDVRIEPVSG